MIDYKAMYMILCEACSKAADMLIGDNLDAANVEEAVSVLVTAMNEAEDVYIETCTDD